jgi:phosphoadenosine phosphosulfate reductase
VSIPAETLLPDRAFGTVGQNDALPPAAAVKWNSGIPHVHPVSSQPSVAKSLIPKAAEKPAPRLTAREIAALDEQFGRLESVDVLTWAWQRFGPSAAIGTSFQGAGLVMMHLAKTAGLPFPVFTLDTGLLFPETLALKARLEDFYEVQIESLTPDLSVEQQAEVQGPELWTRDPDLCCTIRKVLPLRDKLQRLDCWVTGLRRQQSAARAKVGVIELYTLNDQTGQDIVKLNPMANWSRPAIWNYIHEHKIPYNPLHDQGYRSIGCMTCTVKSGDGENERAGRWTGFNKVECGIHTFMSKKIDFQI